MMEMIKINQLWLESLKLKSKRLLDLKVNILRLIE
jgi:hypothetical protein